MSGSKEGIYCKGQKLRPQWLHVHLMFVTLESHRPPPSLFLKVIDHHMFSSSVLEDKWVFFQVTGQ